MSCCGPAEGVPVLQTYVDRRRVVKGMAGLGGWLALVAPGAAGAQDRRVRLAFCGQLL